MMRFRNYLLTGSLLTGLLIFLNWEVINIYRHIFRAQIEIYAQDNGWGEAVHEIVQNLKRETSDQRKLANILLDQDQGSLVAEGMVIVVNEKFTDGDIILKRYTTDNRWNYWFTYNRDFAKMSLGAWKIKSGKTLSPLERENLIGWQNVLQSSFNI